MSYQILLLSVLCLIVPATLQQQLPQVDLGYEVHQALSYNTTYQLYKFANIRYAQPPVGELRFAAPVPPTGRSHQVENGSLPRTCPQAAPAWRFISQQFTTAITFGNLSSFNLTRSQEELQAYLANRTATPPTPGTSEDCLFLDVVVPQAIFDRANNKHRRRNGASGHTGGAPVLVWIYGGGYTAGTKNTFDASGLIKASQAAGEEGIIFVALNYRLGALGWSGGPTLQAAGGVANAGLYDQRLAIEWVSKNIHLFGGDSQQITVMGESAGGGSIQHQITAYGGLEPVSFQRAILQSPGFRPTASQAVQENNAQAFLALLNVSSIEEARQLDSEVVIQANTLQIGAARYGSFLYGPTVDGVFVPALPGLLFNAGRFAKNIEIMNGHQANEAPAFTPPDVQDTASLQELLTLNNPGVQQDALDYITEVLYPESYNGSYPYTNGLERTFLLISESSFTCNTNYVNRAFANQTYAYEFQIPPALHGQDVASTFYNGQGNDPARGVVAEIALVQQAYITNFAMTGDPNGPGLPSFPRQGMNASMNAWNVTGVTTETDPTVNERCAWWQKALYY